MAEEIIGTYIGKSFKGKGKKKDGTEWTSFKIEIKSNMSAQYGAKFDIFDNCKGFDTIKEGDIVKAGFVEGTPYQAHNKTITPKKIIWIGKSSEVVSPSLPAATRDDAPKVEDVLSRFEIVEWDVFVNNYKEMPCDVPGKKCPTHMVACYLMAYLDTDHFLLSTTLAEIYKKAVKALEVDVKV